MTPAQQAARIVALIKQAAPRRRKRPQAALVQIVGNGNAVAVLASHNGCQHDRFDKATATTTATGACTA